MSERGKTLVKGHSLVSEGMGFNAKGQHSWTRSENSHGKCSCGALSPALPSTKARQRWHRTHKAEVAS